MGRVQDYLNGFNPDEINPETFTNDILSAHNEDISIYDAKIESLNNVISAKDNALSAANHEISAVKSQNYDLLMQLPNAADMSRDEETHDGDETTDIDFDDLFGTD
jgi:hypothetical protein